MNDEGLPGSFEVSESRTMPQDEVENNPQLFFKPNQESLPYPTGRLFDDHCSPNTPLYSPAQNNSGDLF